MSKSKHSRPTGKPPKPYDGFPLFAHATRRWAKKIRGKIHYFGPWDDPEGALARFNEQWPHLKDGRTPPPAETGDACRMRELCNAFLTGKQAKVESGELGHRMFREYYSTCQMLLDRFGKDRPVDDLRPDDFEVFRAALAKRYSVTSLLDHINRCKIVLKYAFDQRLVDRPVHYGQSFNRPSSKTLRRARNEAGPKLFTAGEIRSMNRPRN